jgi:antigen flippase
MSSTSIENQLSDPSAELLPQLVATVPAKKQTYGQILKSSAVIGGSSVLNIGIGIVRTKAMAILLGPAGFGLAGLYTSIVTLTQSVAGMGINSSGVREIAEAAGGGDKERIARTVAVLRRTSIILGVLGAALLVVFSPQVSKVTFGNTQRTGTICVLSLAVFFQLVSAAQGALLQGMRRIADMAKMNVIGALSGAVISIPVVYFFRERGIAFALVCVAAMTIITSWFYVRKIHIPTPTMTIAQVGQGATSLLKLGVAFMVSGFVVTGVAYVVRVILLHRVGIAATGWYQSAWTLGGLYVGFILQAMGADFYPRLSAVANDNAECNRLVNEQALVGLLLAGPGVIATLTFAPLVIALFYSAKFGAAVPVLRWICLGATLQVITWPMGFIILAKARQDFFLFSEVVWAAVAMALAWMCVGLFGLNGAGIAFFGSYIFHWILTYPLVRHLSGFRWSTENTRTGLLLLPLIAIVFGSFYLLPFAIAVCIGIVGLLLSGAYSLHAFVRLVELEEVPPAARRVMRFLGPLLRIDVRIKTAGSIVDGRSSSAGPVVEPQ